MAYHFFSIPVCGSPNVEELNQLLDHAKVASVKREFVADGENSFWVFDSWSKEKVVVPPSGG